MLLEEESGLIRIPELLEKEFPDPEEPEGDPGTEDWFWLEGFLEEEPLDPGAATDPVDCSSSSVPGVLELEWLEPEVPGWFGREEEFPVPVEGLELLLLELPPGVAVLEDCDPVVLLFPGAFVLGLLPGLFVPEFIFGFVLDEPLETFPE